MIRTPLQLQFLLHCHCYPEPHPMAGLEVWDQARDYLVNEGMIEVLKKDKHFTQYIFKTTEKGQFYINHLMSVPFPIPVSSWSIPDQQALP